MERWSRAKRALAVVTQLAVLAAGVAAYGAAGKPVATVTIPPNPQLYATDPQPLTVTQCGQCHTGVFRNLKNDGARHRFGCQECHTTFHSHNPKKGNWDAIMPKCESCHKPVHGETAKDCASCHTNPHTPKKVEMGPRLLNACGECHGGPKAELAQYPSKHALVGCVGCHSTHGFKPSCLQCHKPHDPSQGPDACRVCHQVHHPLQVTYPKDLPSKSCGACHTAVFAKWEKTPSRHGKVACVTCHADRHRFIPQCTQCHPNQHQPEFLKKFPSCLSCHLDVHDPPAKRKPAKP